MPFLPALGLLLSSLVGSFLARVLLGAGLALGSYAAMRGITAGLLSVLHDQLGNLPNALIALISMSGVGEGLSMVGSAFITRAAIKAASVFIKQAAG